MKHLFTLIFAVVLLSCTSEQNDPAPSDLTGTWQFIDKNINLQLKIVKAIDGKYVIESGSEFSVKGNKHAISDNINLTITGLDINYFTLNGPGTSIAISQSSYSPDFKEIKIPSYMYWECSGCPGVPVDQQSALIRK